MGKKMNYHPFTDFLLIGCILILSCNEINKPSDSMKNGDQDETELENAVNTSTGWDDIDLHAVIIRYDELISGEVEARESGKFIIYSVGEEILFEKGSASLNSDMKNNLDEIATSINKRHTKGEIRIYGYADPEGKAADNLELSKKRSESVMNYLSEQGIDSNRMSVHARGEVTGDENVTKRKVEVVVMK